MADTKLADLTEALPLLDDNGSGVYNKGRNTARDFRIDLIGASFCRGTISTAHGVLAHVWIGDGVTGYFREYRATAQGTPSRVLSFAGGRIITPRTGQGAYLITQEADFTVTMPNADGSLARIDRLYVMAGDKGAFVGDVDHGPVVRCITGTPNASPVAPTLPADAEPLCDVFRRAGASGDQIAQGDITDKRIGASLSREPRPLLGGDSLSDFGFVHGEQRLRTGAFVNSGIPRNVLVDRWDDIADVWVGTQGFKLTARLTAPGTITTGGVRVGSQIVIPDPGWAYRISGSAHVRLNVTGGPGPNTATLQLRAGSSSPASAHDGTVVAVGVCQNFGTGGYWGAEMGTADNVFTGSTTVYKMISNNTGATATLVGATEPYDTFTVVVDPA
jgi:hypothetical protein